jgi:Protein of unknown function (DUF1566)
MHRTLLAVLLLLTAAPALAKPPSWDRIVATPKRFKVLKAFADAAVLDQETGLVWEREPAATMHSWSGAIEACTTRLIGARNGWRLPTVSELRSLVPIEAAALPDGHPFLAPNGVYWTSTLYPGDTELAFTGDLASPTGPVFNASTNSTLGAWCVRGPSANGL